MLTFRWMRGEARQVTPAATPTPGTGGGGGAGSRGTITPQEERSFHNVVSSKLFPSVSSRHVGFIKVDSFIKVDKKLAIQKKT